MKQIKKYLLIILLICSYTTQGQILTKDIRSEEKILGLSRFWSEAKITFPYFENIPQINWDSCYQSFIPKVVATKSIFEYYQVLSQFCKLLKDGHTVILLPPGFYYDTLYTPPFYVKNVEERAFVYRVHDSLMGIIPFGSEIIEIEGLPTRQYILERVLPYICEGTEAAAWNRAIERNLLLGIRNTNLNLAWKTPDGKITRQTFVRNYPFNRKNELEYPDTLVNGKWLTNGIYYVNILTFSNEKIINQFQDLLPELYKAKSVIVDIRDNTGGNDAYAAELVKYFTTMDTIVGAKVLSRYTISAHKAFARSNADYRPFVDNTAFIELEVKKYANNKEKKIHSPLVVLINVETRSASENFLVALDSTKRSTLIGESTGGTTGQPYFFNLTGGLRACIVAPKNVYPNGRFFVGFGIKPDIEIHPTVNDFMKKRDVILERAVDYLSRNKTNH